MTESNSNGNPSTANHSTVGDIAPLRNVTLLTALIERVMKRAAGLPGMACFYGRSGDGKTSAAIYNAHKFKTCHVQVQSTWTRRFLADAIAFELSIEPAKNVPMTIEAIAREFLEHPRPLIIDEADYLLRANLIELVRDIHDASGTPIILIGEEKMPQKVRKWERVHGRMLDWVAAVPATYPDARKLAGIRCRGLAIDDDLLAAIFEASAGSARRIVVNLDRIREQCEKKGAKSIRRADYAGEFFTGAPPTRRQGAAPELRTV
jgi:DNA transposition AAA+ family ATPase